LYEIHVQKSAGVALAKLGGGGRGGIKIIAPKIIIPIVPPGIAHGWGPPLKYWTYAPLHLFRKTKQTNASKSFGFLSTTHTFLQDFLLPRLESF
jgi:hypothetical protein